MARTPKHKELINTRLASTYGGWIYCGHCGETVGYLCYVTYDSFTLKYRCKCGSSGSMHLSFLEDDTSTPSDKELITVKNRLCYPEDQSPLFTLLTKKLDSYQYEAVCAACNTKFTEEKT